MSPKQGQARGHGGRAGICGARLRRPGYGRQRGEGLGGQHAVLRQGRLEAPVDRRLRFSRFDRRDELLVGERALQRGDRSKSRTRGSGTGGWKPVRVRPACRSAK